MEEVMALSGFALKELALLAVELDATPHGSKQPLKDAFCDRFLISKATLGRELSKVMDSNRKQRSDAGKTSVTLDELRIISAYWMECFRRNAKKDTSLKEVVSVLRANNKIVAGRTDPETGEHIPYSEQAIATALRNAILHPEQLRQLSPSTNLQSRHPNHVWQIDSTTSAQFYLDDAGGGFAEIEDGVHYKNKPENLKKIERHRVICYSIVDHASGYTFWRYYKDVENAEHTVRFLADAMAKKAWTPFNGSPQILMCDKGLVNALVKRFCQTMQIRLMPHATGNARATGSVERSHRSIQEDFEQSIKILPRDHADVYRRQPRNFDDLNTMAAKYQVWYNASKIHSRTKKTRMAVWLSITAPQLITVPTADVLLSLATEDPVSRKVKSDLTVNFKSRIWDVKDVQGVYVGSEVMVHWHPFMADTAMAVIIDSAGHETHIALPEKTQNDLGFLTDAAMIGEEYKSKPDTIADTNRKLVAQLSAGTTTQEATDKKRKRKDYVPFDGAIDSQIASRVELPTYLPKRGTELELDIPSIDLPKLNHIQFAKFGKQRLGDAWSADLWGELKRKFPQGATEPELEQWFSGLDSQDDDIQRPQLRIVK